MSSPEKRKHSRWNINPGYPCRIQSGGATIDGRLIDLSAMGAYVESETPPSVGSQLSIDVESLEFDDEGPIAQSASLTGTVRHQGPSARLSATFAGFGVEFEGVSAETLTAIQEVTILPTCPSLG